ncbi:C2 family cysteine protease [Mycobacterium sp. NPDC051198]
MSTRHLIDLHSQLSAHAQLIETSFSEAHHRLASVTWEGEGHTAAVKRTDTDRTTAITFAERYRHAADIAKNGDARLLAAQLALVNLVNQTRAAGFTVRNDWTVSAYTPARSIADAMSLQPQANELSAEIQKSVQALMSIDRQISADLTSALAGTSELIFTEAPLYADELLPRRPIGSSIFTWTDDDLYPNDPAASDIRQDNISDCYLLAAMGAVANANSQWIKDRIRYDDSSGTFDVTLWDGREWKHLPVTQDDINTNIAKKGGSWLDNNRPHAALWPAVLESAYAKLKYPDMDFADSLGKNGLDKRGYTDVAMEALTGNKGTTINPQLVFLTREHIDQEIAAALANHQPVTIGTTSQADPLSSRHIYIVEGITGAGSDAQVTLRNPWENNRGTPIDTGEPTVTVRLGDLIGSGVPSGRLPNGPLGHHPTSSVTIGSLG